MGSSQSHCKVVRRIVRENPRLLLGIIAWLAGYTRFDVKTMIGVDLDEARRYGVVLDDFRDVVKISGREFRRFSQDDIHELVEPCLDIDEIFSIIQRLGTAEELKVLLYTADYVKRMGRFSVYGISDYIRCTELLENVNVEYKVLVTVLKYLVYMCDRTYSCTEYKWTSGLLDRIRQGLSRVGRLPSDEDIMTELERVLNQDLGLNVIAAMYSMSTNSTDQFQVFHRRSVQEFLRGVTTIRYVYHNGFLNGLAVPLIERVVEERIVKPLVLKLADMLGSQFCTKVEEDLYRHVYSIGETLVVFPKLYYISPIFWAKPGCVNVLYELPPCVDSYLTLYRPYFEKGVLLLCRGTEIIRAYCFDADANLCKQLSRCIDVVYL